MSAIKAGDTVLIIRGHCTQQAAGSEETALALGMMPAGFLCLTCGSPAPIVPAAQLDVDEWAPLSWLMKIDPQEIEISHSQEREPHEN